MDLIIFHQFNIKFEILFQLWIHKIIQFLRRVVDVSFNCLCSHLYPIYIYVIIDR
jgi:hypothetical protein